MRRKVIDDIFAKTMEWVKVGFLPIMILLFFFLGLGFLWSVGLRIALYLIIYWVCSEILRRSNWLLEKITPQGVKIFSAGLALLFTLWIILIQISIFPDNVNIKFENLFTTKYSFSGSNASELSLATINFIQENVNILPLGIQKDTLENEIRLGASIASSSLDVVGNIALVRVTAVPKPKRVFVLVHPHNTPYWYAQTPLTFVATKERDYWEGYVYFGPLNGDCNLKFDLILLGSKDWLWLDIFRGRGLRAGMELDYLPVLNQSETIVVQKMCGEK